MDKKYNVQIIENKIKNYNKLEELQLLLLNFIKEQKNKYT